MATSRIRASALRAILRPRAAVSIPLWSLCQYSTSASTFAPISEPVSTSSPSLPPPDALSSPSSLSSSPLPSASYPKSNMPTHAPLEYHIKSGIILSRPPLLTQLPTDFETAYYFYQKRLNERIVLPFSHHFYFKRDTPAQLDWAIKLRERQGIVAREVGQYNGKSPQAWDDELLVGDPLSKPETLVDAILVDAQQRVSEDAEEIPEADRVPIERPLPRTTEADEKGEVRRLDRKLDRTLYLVVRRENGPWEFPADLVKMDENLHKTAKRVLDSSTGANMNTWIVSRVPVAHIVRDPIPTSPTAQVPSLPSSSTETKKDMGSSNKPEKIFFLKGRIMAGQADLSQNPFGLVDFQWLTREELQEVLAPEYFHSVRNMMADR